MQFTSKYKIVEWEDETSMFDPKGRWEYGNDYYVRTYKAIVPIELETDEETSEYIEDHEDCYVDSMRAVAACEQKGDDYIKAKKLGLTSIDRWDKGLDHHPMSGRLVDFLAEHDVNDYNDYNDYFCWSIGGDGDNGETLMHEMDAFFEMLDGVNRNQDNAL